MSIDKAKIIEDRRKEFSMSEKVLALGTLTVTIDCRIIKYMSGADLRMEMHCTDLENDHGLMASISDETEEMVEKLISDAILKRCIQRRVVMILEVVVGNPRLPENMSFKDMVALAEFALEREALSRKESMRAFQEADTVKNALTGQGGLA